MPTGRQGSIHLFRFSGIDVFLHWSWFLVAMIEVESRRGSYSSISWNVFEYLALFLIVLLHEFGHALACRQVGGKADRIVLWPLGGVAYVDPPQRPGATLWSIAAGPLVNVALLPLLAGLYYFGRSSGWAASMPDVYRLTFAMLAIDIGLFVFNILPIYPLDGGQILRSLLWFVLGRARSLMVATVLGLVGVVGFFAIALYTRDIWLGAIAVFMLMNCWGGLRHAQSLLKMAKLPKHEEYSCPNCKTSPPLGAYWRCGQCGQPFDTFQSGAVCPYCSTQFPATQCLNCGNQHPLNEWAATTIEAPTIQYVQPGSGI
ncbi:MAG: M50 family metallopeptidase [Candidatus Sulfotelmatobacter sp.]